MLKKFGILGTGKMGRVLAVGLHRVHAGFEFFLYNPTAEKSQKLAEDVQGTQILSLDQLPNLDIVLIACRPQQFNDLAQALKGRLKGDEVVLSIMAAIPTSTLAAKLGVTKIVRMMPNTPNKIELGVNLFYFTPTIGLPERTQILNAFAQFSSVFNLEKEDQLDICTAFTGSGPALIFEWARLMIEILTERGIAHEDANKMVIQTFLGSATLLATDGQSPAELKQQVSSRGGVTIEALRIFEEAKMKEIIERATQKAYLRGKEIERSL